MFKSGWSQELAKMLLAVQLAYVLNEESGGKLLWQEYLKHIRTVYMQDGLWRQVHVP